MYNLFIWLLIFIIIIITISIIIIIYSFRIDLFIFCWFLIYGEEEHDVYFRHYNYAAFVTDRRKPSLLRT